MKWYESALLCGRKLPAKLEKLAIIKSLRNRDRRPALVALHRRSTKKPNDEPKEDNDNSD